MNTGESAFVLYIDMKKAFDWVHRELLELRLLEYEINGNMLRAISSLYDGVNAYINLNGYVSEKFEINVGVKQGM